MGPFVFLVFGPMFLKTGNHSQNEIQLIAKINNHVGFVAADFASPGLFLFLLGFAGWRLNVDPLAAYGHLRFIPAFFAHTHFHFVSHYSLLSQF
jgi:hypothetical protein